MLMGERKASRWRRASASTRFTSVQDRKSTRLNSSHLVISYAVFCLKKKKKELSYIAEPVEDMIFGAADWLQELAVGPVSAARLPVGWGSRPVHWLRVACPGNAPVCG